MSGQLGTGDDALTPAQRRVLVDLMARGRPRPRFDPAVAAALRADLEEAIGPVLDRSPDPDVLWVTKGALSRVHACEAHFQAAADEPFSWNALTARGSVAHRALELSVTTRAEVAPLELIDRAIESLAGDERRTSPSPWLRSASEVEIADLRSGANEVVAKFLECWPPLSPRWAPRTETGIGAELCQGRVLLWGRVDLLLGQARGDEARGLVVDLKTGRAHPPHLDDLRFYALVQALRVGVPPFRVASYYLDIATYHHEDVTEGTLAITVRRVADGVRKLVELRAGRPPTITPGPQCGWCSLAESCDGPARWRATATDVADSG